MLLRPTIHKGSLTGALGLIGTGLAMALPSQNWIGWVVVALGVLVFFLDIHREHGHIEVGTLKCSLQRKKIIALAGMTVCGLGLFAFLGAYLWPASVVRTMAPVEMNPKEVTPPLARMPTSTNQDRAAPSDMPEAESVPRQDTTPFPTPFSIPSNLEKRDAEQVREFIDLDFSALSKQMKQLNGIQARKVAELYLGKWLSVEGYLIAHQKSLLVSWYF
jgi:hypothetical protein